MGDQPIESQEDRAKPSQISDIGDPTSETEITEHSTDSDALVEEIIDTNESLVESHELDGETLIRGRYFVDSSAPLSSLDSPTARAYKVDDRSDINNDLFALVCSPNLPTRLGTMRFNKRHYMLSTLEIVDWGVLFWPPLSKSTMIVIFRKPNGGRVIDRIKSRDIFLSGYEVPLKIVRPIVSILLQLQDEGLSHRSIRANNMFFKDESFSEVVIGENVTAPPGFDQESIYEPIERAMCNPEGRGIGSVADDIYALGTI